MFELNGKTALVTGASRGLGKGAALCLAKAGADIVVNYAASEKSARETAAEITALGRKAYVIRADVGSEESVKSMFDEIGKTAGRIDILINNAGINSDDNIETMTREQWDRIIACNLTGNFLCAKYAFEMMKERRWGRIIQITSVVGEQGALYGQVHYAATKGGQMSFTKTLARTAAPYGVTVNGIAPGVIMTDQVESILGKEVSPRLKRTLDWIPLGALGKPEDIGTAAVFLASEEAGYITGEILNVNGGFFMA